MKLKTFLIAVVSLTSLAAADPFSGQVYGVYPEGVMVNYGGGSYLVPTQHATFQVGNITATWSSLQPGQNVYVRVPDPYWGGVTRVADPYQWKMKNHPNHPHGGPPGQMKKQGRGNSGNNGNGKGKGKKW